MQFCYVHDDDNACVAVQLLPVLNIFELVLLEKVQTPQVDSWGNSSYIRQKEHTFFHWEWPLRRWARYGDVRSSLFNSATMESSWQNDFISSSMQSSAHSTQLCPKALKSALLVRSCSKSQIRCLQTWVYCLYDPPQLHVSLALVAKLFFRQEALWRLVDCRDCWACSFCLQWICVCSFFQIIPFPCLLPSALDCPACFLWGSECC